MAKFDLQERDVPHDGNCFFHCLAGHALKCVQWVVLGRSVVCLAGHHSSCLSSMGQIDMKMFVVSAGWCPQLINEY